MLERPFTNEVIEFARDHHWEVFHIHDQDSRENYQKIATGGGYPDLVMYRTDEHGKSEMIVAELKVDAAYSRVRPNQREWMNAYKQFIPTFEWRPSEWNEIERILRDGPAETDGVKVSEPAVIVDSKEKLLPSYLTAIVNNLRTILESRSSPVETTPPFAEWILSGSMPRSLENYLPEETFPTSEVRTLNKNGPPSYKVLPCYPNTTEDIQYPSVKPFSLEATGIGRPFTVNSVLTSYWLPEAHSCAF